MIPSRSPSRPAELYDDHLHDLRVELCPVALRAPVVVVACTAAAFLFRLFAAVLSLFLFAILLLLVLALSPPFSSAFL